MRQVPTILAALDNWLFFLFVAIAVIFQVLSRAAKTAGKSSDESDDQPASRPPPLPRQYEQDSDAERIRKFLEALGQPTTNAPPPPAVPRTNVPPRPVAPVQPPRTMVTFPRKQKMPPPVPKIIIPERAAKAVPQTIGQTSEGPTRADLMRVLKSEAATSKPKKQVAVETDIVALLRSRSGLRNAMILREVFGPPRSMQPLDFV